MGLTPRRVMHMLLLVAVAVAVVRETEASPARGHGLSFHYQRQHRSANGTTNGTTTNGTTTNTTATATTTAGSVTVAVAPTITATHAVSGTDGGEGVTCSGKCGCGYQETRYQLSGSTVSVTYETYLGDVHQWPAIPVFKGV